MIQLSSSGITPDQNLSPMGAGFSKDSMAASKIQLLSR